MQTIKSELFRHNILFNIVYFGRYFEMDVSSTTAGYKIT